MTMPATAQDQIDIFGETVTRMQLSQFKSWFVSKCPKNCPMPRWMPAIYALPSLDQLNNCAHEWKMLVEASSKEWISENK